MTEKHTPALDESEVIQELDAAPASAATERTDYVGHGCPPKAHQFKPGQSGNPKGRPPGRHRPETLMASALMEPTVLPNGRSFSIQELIAKCVKGNLIKGNLKAVREAERLLEKYCKFGADDSEDRLDQGRLSKLKEAHERMVTGQRDELSAGAVDAPDLPSAFHQQVEEH